MKIFTLVAAVAALALSACCNPCDPCNPSKKPIYQKPCCARSQEGGAAPTAAPAPAPAPKPAGGQMACGTGKCG